MGPLDVFHLPPGQRGDIKIYKSTGSQNLSTLRRWQKPKFASMVYMFAVSGGGGGGPGFTRTAGNPGGGGGSGAGSGFASLLIPAIFLPNELFIQVGAGGLGGTPGNAGGNGLNSYILTGGVTATNQNVVLFSGTNAPGGGGAGTAGAAGAAGSIPTIATTNQWAKMGIWQAQVGPVGVIGGAQTGATGTDVNAWGNFFFGAGASGAGCTTTDFRGGLINISGGVNFDLAGNGYYSNASGGLGPAGTAGGGNGSSWVTRYNPFISNGGSGGGSNNSGQAGHGGNGGIGSGGGGGGAGATGGNGGNGGDGIVIIISY